MKNKKEISKDTVKRMEELSHLSIDEKEKDYFTRQFNETLDVINDLNKVDTEEIMVTNQVTGLVNVFRDDLIDKDRILSQKDALLNSKNTHGGYFVVKAVLNEK